MNNHRKILSLLLICLLLLTACGRPGRNTADPQAETGTFIYYLNNERTTLKTSEYKLPENMEEEDVLDDMLDNLAAPFADGIAPISGFTLQGRSLDKGMLILDFSEEYEQLDALDEILIRGAIVKTVCQLVSVRQVFFTINQESLVRNGEEVGVMGPDSFAISTSTSMGQYDRIQIYLYLTGKEQDKLKFVTRMAAYNINSPMERVIVEQLITGPKGAGYYPTVNPATQINSITTKDGLCIVDLNGDFLTPPNKVSLELSVWSLVNSLTRLDNVDKVQIVIDGDQSISIGEDSESGTIFVQNLEMVEGYDESKLNSSGEDNEGEESDEDE